jgi:hypothetical protein
MKMEAQQFPLTIVNTSSWQYWSKHALQCDVEKLLKGITFEKFCRKSCHT